MKNKHFNIIITIISITTDELKNIKPTACVVVTTPAPYSIEQRTGLDVFRPWELPSPVCTEDECSSWKPFNYPPGTATPGNMSSRERGTAKGRVTKAIRTLNREISAFDHDAVEKQIETLRSAFEDFEVVHDAHHESLTVETDIRDSDAYFNEIEQDYIAVVSKANKWLFQYSRSAEDGSSNDTSLSTLCEYMSMPNISIDSFGGDPLMFKAFMSIFDETVHNKPVDDALKLSRLLQFTKGEAKSSIRHCAVVGGSSGYQQARKILSERFGDKHLIAQRVIENLKSGRPVVTPSDLQQLADDLSMASESLKSLDLFTELSNQRSMVDILQRCPAYVKTKWQRKALSKKSESGSYPSFDDFVGFIRDKAAESLDPIYGTDAMKPKSGRSNDRGFNGSLQGANGRNSGGKSYPSCVVCKSSHSLFYCDQFKSMKPTDRLAVVRQNKLCFLCLQSGHGSLNCGKTYRCSVPGCGKRHTKFVHTDNQPSRGKQQNDSDTNGSNGALGSNNGTNGSDANVGHTNATSGNVYLPILPVRINDDPRVFYCLLDSGSTNTLVDQSLASSLNLQVNNVNYSVKSVSGKSHIDKAVSMKVTTLDGSQTVKLNNVLMVPDIPANLPSVKVNVSRYPHLADLPIHYSSVGVRAQILIGLDHAHVLVPSQVRANPDGKNEPYATRTLLGWALNGPVDGVASASMASQVCAAQVCDAEDFRNSIEDQVENLWHIEVDESRDHVNSQVDEQVLQMWDRDTELIDGHYHVPIPFRTVPLDFPDNFNMAKRRLYFQKKRLDKAGLTDRYSEGIQKFMDKGYAERVPEDEISLNDGSVWYLPHFHVLHEAKGKLRIVMDCAATHQGISLNSQCHQGPNLLNNLLHILLRFRQYPYAIMADVESMYLNVRVPVAQRNALRFLYFGSEGELVYMRMTSHLFGRVFSGSASAYALQRMCRDNPTSELVTDVIMRSFYVDDLARSLTSAELAREALFDTQRTLMLGSMNLTKMIANDETIVSEIPLEHRASEVKEFKPAVIMSKALGVCWEVKADQFLYVSRPVTDGKPLTRRVILSQIATMFDPVGLVGCVIVKGRTIFQDLTRMKIGWDELVPAPVAQRWFSWFRSLDHLNVLRFDRCLLTPEFLDSAAQLVHFCDASEKAYGGCVYLRAVNRSGNIRVVLVMSKGRLAPLKRLSIPRLELCSAVESVRLDVVLRREIDIPLIDSIFFTDSQIVKSYIYNEDKRYKVFVANRLAEIRRGSRPDQWHHVDGSLTPADVLSRGCDATDVPGVWFTGPDFLYCYKSDWAEDSSVCRVGRDDPEVVSACMLDDRLDDSQRSREHPLEKLISYYSDFYKLKKAVAWFLRYKDFLRDKVNCSYSFLDASELRCAEVLLCKYVQMTSFEDEVARLSEGKNVLGCSSIVKLDPCIEDGILVVGGRLRHSALR